MAISFNDGAQYARTSEELAEGSGETVVLFRSTLTARWPAKPSWLSAEPRASPD